MNLLQSLTIMGAMLCLTSIIALSRGVWRVSTFCAILFFLGFGVRTLIIQSDPTFVVFGLFHLAPSLLLWLDWCGLGAMICMAAGIFAAPKKWMAAKQIPVKAADEFQRVQYRAAFIICLSIAMACVFMQAVVLSVISGGLSHAVRNFAQRTIQNTAGLGLLAAAALQLESLALATVLASIVCAMRAGSRLMTMLSLISLLALLPWYATLSGRADVVIILWAAVMTINQLTTNRVSPLWLLAALPGIAFLAVFGYAFRLAAQTNIPIVEALKLSSSRIIFTTSDSLPMIDATYIGWEFVQRAGHNLINTLIAPFTVLVPRALWPGKPLFAPQMINEVVTHSTLSGLPAGIVGEGYIAFGVIGSALFSFLIGILAAAADYQIKTRSMGELLKPWFIVTTVGAALMGIRVGFQGVIIAIEFALPWFFIIWTVQRGIYSVLRPNSRVRSSIKISGAISRYWRA